MKKRRLIVAVMLVSAWCTSWCAYSAESAVFNQGCKAFKAGDWTAAAMLLRRSQEDAKYDTDATQYMLIMAQMNANAPDAASEDCDTFMVKFPDSEYLPLVQYQKGRALFLLGEYDKCALLLSDFCHQYPDSPLYPSALFWIAECFFATGNLAQANALYTRLTDEFPKSGKTEAARHRMEAIASRKREEQLLYLLKKTGEEYIAAKEGYDRGVGTQDKTEAPSVAVQAETQEDETLSEVIRRLKEKAGVAETFLDSATQFPAQGKEAAE